MEREWLEQELAAGRSIESIARKVGKHPSTVSYWVKKHGLRSRHTELHGRRGSLSRERLEALIARDLSTREIAADVGRSATTVNYWLRRYGLRTTAKGGRPGRKTDVAVWPCDRHGGSPPAPGLRTVCPGCRIEAVTGWRRRAKRILVEEAGGCCALCGYARCVGALEFHHVDPAGRASVSAPADSPARSMHCARRRGNACYCAETAMRKSRRGLCT